MAQPTSPDEHGRGCTNGGEERDQRAVRLNRLRTAAETAGPAEAREAAREAVGLSRPGDDGEALRLPVRFSVRSDCTDRELLLLWSTADGDPGGFCEDLLAPVYCTRKAVRKLVSLSALATAGRKR